MTVGGGDGLANDGRTSSYPLAALGLLTLIDQLEMYVFVVLAPDISRSIGLSRPATAGLVLLKMLIVSSATLPIAAIVGSKPRRALISLASALTWSVTTILTAFVIRPAGLLLVFIFDAATSASVEAVHRPLIVDSYSKAARVKALSVYQAFTASSSLVGPLLVATLTSILELTWRGVYLAFGLLSLLGCLFAIRLRDPGIGGPDEGRNVTGHARARLLPAPTFFETVHEVLRIPTMKRVLTASVVLGALVFPLFTYLTFFLEEKWGLTAGQRGIFWSFIAAFQIAGMFAFWRRADRMMASRPDQLITVSAWAIGSSVWLIAIGVFLPQFWLMTIALAAGSVLSWAVFPAQAAIMQSLVRPTARAHAAALSGSLMFGAGGFAGLVLFSGLDRQFGIPGAIASMIIPGTVFALVMSGASKTVVIDLDETAQRSMDEAQSSQAVMTRQIPLLEVKRMSFSYGHMPALSDVDIILSQGEAVALLGTNGAGKSTLLNVVSGTNLPDRGVVRWQGHDITYFEPERRARAGIMLVPAPRSTFWSLTLEEHLQVFLGKGDVKKEIHFLIEMLPSLASAVKRPVSTLSGGERQLVGLARAYFETPRLLMVDELSSGLAAKSMVRVMNIVKELHSRGSALLIADQSIRVALEFASRAYFLEKGQVRFEGPVQELVKREDLIRSVFLQPPSRQS